MRLLWLLLALSVVGGAWAAGRTRKIHRRPSSSEEEPVTRARSLHRHSEQGTKCGYESCHPVKEGVINVHLVPHTHDDVGWLKTPDEYYFGANQSIAKAGVQYILDSVVDELMKDPSRRFVYVESFFFWKWWSEQGDQRRHHVRRLVNEGRLEFAGGAWSMHDEAVTHYQSSLDSLTWGLRMLNDTFGSCGRPRAAWQIDPFGHSRESAFLFSMAGYDGLMLGRADYQDVTRRFNSKEAEMIWRGSDDVGQATDLFTGIMFKTYSPPPGFCWDILCSDDPIIDDPRSPNYNVEQKMKEFLAYISNQMLAYKTNHLIVTMGGDFTYQDAGYWYKNMDKLIKYVNAREPKINLLYSTPSCYIKAVHDSKVTFPSKQDDFFPYASDQHSYWTGYFTSRPTLKFYERRGNNFLQVCKQLYAMTNLNEKDKVDLNMLRSAMGVMQHHDAVTGTEQQHVARDYARLLEEGIQDCLITVRESLNQLMSEKPRGVQEDKKAKKKSSRDEDEDVPYMPMTTCHLNITECSVSETSSNFIVTVYNPLGHVIRTMVRIPVTGKKFSVKDATGEEFPTQMLSLPRSVLKQLLSRRSNATGELVFRIENLLPLGYKSFYVTEVSGQERRQLEPAKQPEQSKLAELIRPKDDGKFDVEDKQEGTPLQSNDFPPEYEQRVRFSGMQADARLPTITVDSFYKPVLELSGANEDKIGEFARKLSDAIDEENSIENDNLKITIDPTTGFINFLMVKEGGNTTKIPLRQELMFYEGAVGDNEEPKNRSSGAYIFRPLNSDPKSIVVKPKNSVIKGPLVEEIHQVFSDWASQIIRINREDHHVEFEWMVGPIPVDDTLIGKEVISRFTTDINSNGEFYTDSNGRQLLKRIRNKRPTWDLQVEEPIAGNYYPVTSMMGLKDSERELFIMTDRAQGGSSLKDGQLEFMVHRRLLHDDAFGVGEALNEMEDGNGLVARGTHYLIAGTPEKNEMPLVVWSRQLALEKLLQPEIFLTPAENITFDEWKTTKTEFSGLNSELPANVHLLTLEPWKDRTILVRLEHFLQKTDDPNTMSKQAVVNLRKLFSGIKIVSVRETTLGANQYLEDSDRLIWASSDMLPNFNDAYKNVNSSKKEDEYYKQIDEMVNIDTEPNQDDAVKMVDDNDGDESKIGGVTSFSESLGAEEKKKLNYYLDDYFPDNYVRESRKGKDDSESRSNDRSKVKNNKAVPLNDELNILLDPMQIRTFIIHGKFLD